MNHNLLLQKLTHYGIQGKGNEWLQFYLENRQQEVKIMIKGQIKKEVPHGSILGPLLFLIYTNHLDSYSQFSNTEYVDDTCVIISDKGNNKILNLVKMN